MKEVPHLSMAACYQDVVWIGRRLYKVHICPTRDQGLHPESRMWFGIGIKILCLIIRKRTWFRLNINNYCVSEVTTNLFYIKQEHDLSQTLTKCFECLNIKMLKKNNTALTISGFCTARWEEFWWKKQIWCLWTFQWQHIFAICQIWKIT